MNNLMSSLATAFITAGVLTGLTACVSNGSYDQVKNDAEELSRQYQAEHKRAADLTFQNKAQKQKIEQLEASLNSWRQDLARTEKEWKEMRDNLLKFKVEYELQRSGTRDRFRVEPEKVELDTKGVTPDGQLSSRETQGRIKELKDVLQHVQRLLE